jgi:hypothetical protein
VLNSSAICTDPGQPLRLAGERPGLRPFLTGGGQRSGARDGPSRHACRFRGRPGAQTLVDGMLQRKHTAAGEPVGLEAGDRRRRRSRLRRALRTARTAWSWRTRARAP